METTKVVCNKEFQIDRVDSRLFGSFLEHMGRVIYSGIYEPDNKNDQNNFSYCSHRRRRNDEDRPADYRS